MKILRLDFVIFLLAFAIKFLLSEFKPIELTWHVLLLKIA